MAEGNSTGATFPLYPIAILLTIILWVANLIGWIHVAWWVIALPIFAVVGITLVTLVVAAIILAIGFLIYLGVERRDRKKHRSGIVTPMRHRGVK